MVEAPWKIGIPVYIKHLATQLTSTDSATWATSTDLDLPVVAGGIYWATWNLIGRTPTTTTGIRFRLMSASATLTRMAIAGRGIRAAQGSTSEQHGAITGFNVIFNTSDVHAAATDVPIELSGTIVVNAGGVIRLDVSTEVNTEQASLEVGSHVFAQRIA